MDNEKELSAEESFRLIQSMIEKTKGDAADNIFYFLFWGWLVFMICILQYILMVWVGYEKHYMAWSLLWIGFVVTMVHAWKKKREARAETYMGASMKYLWTAIGISFFVLGCFCAISRLHNCFPLFILLYAIGTFASGFFLKFRPFVAGGIICWILTIVAAFATEEIQVLLTALALLASYIIPGHLLRIRYQKQKQSHS